MQLEHLRMQPSQKDGGSGDDDGLHRKGAVRVPLACGRRCYTTCTRQEMAAK
jgi:hypothetical protein